MTDREALAKAILALRGAKDLIEGDFEYPTLTNGMRDLNEDRMKELHSIDGAILRAALHEAILMLSNRPWRPVQPATGAVLECRKCGATDISATYNPGVIRHHWSSELQLRDSSLCHNCGVVGHHRADEHLDKFCRSCRYEWEEDCLIQGEGR